VLWTSGCLLRLDCVGIRLGQIGKVVRVKPEVFSAKYSTGQSGILPAEDESGSAVTLRPFAPAGVPPNHGRLAHLSCSTSTFGVHRYAIPNLACHFS
jgi:hypothetical protein